MGWDGGGGGGGGGLVAAYVVCMYVCRECWGRRE